MMDTSHLPLALRLLRQRKAAALAFVIFYGLGLAVYLWVDGLWRRVDTELAARGQDLLEADLQIESRRPFTEAESTWVASVMPPETKRAQAFGFLSMVATASNESRLVQIKAIDAAYPLFGHFVFDTNITPGFALSQWQSGEVLAPHGLLAALRLKVGDSVSVGARRFALRAVYLERPGSGFDLWEMSGRLYIPLADLASTGLEQKGSRIFRYRFYALPPNTNLRSVRDTLLHSLDDPEIEIRTTADQDTDLGRLLANVGSFIKILALGAFWLAAIGATFFFNRHLEAERKTGALLRSLGMSPWRIPLLYLAQCLGLALVAALLGGALAEGLSYLLTGWISERYHMTLAPGLPWGTLALGLVLPVCTAVLFVLPQLALLARTSPASLLLPAEPKPLPRLWSIAFFTLQMGWIVCMARLLSNSWVLAGWAWVAWLTAWASIGTLAFLLSAVLWRLRTLWGYADRVLLGSLRQRPTRALTAFFALGFTTFALALLPILRQSLAKELASPTGHALPSLFLFDVQEDQEADIRAKLTALDAPLQSLSPMVRARLMKVNGQSFKRDSGQIKTLEARKQKQMRNRGFNLSYRDSLSTSETLLEGRMWTGSATEAGMAEISIEKRFAANLNLRLHDTLTFDVQGIEVSGRITSFRRVKWNSFQPNFFVLFQPGVLEEAPKTFIGTVAASGPQSALVRDTLVKAHPNISVMEVGDAIQRLDDLMGQLQSMVGLLSWGYLLIGLGILGMVVESSARDSQRSLLLLRALGATPRTLISAGARHYAIFSLAATGAGLLLAMLVSAAILHWVWDMPFSPPGRTVALGILGGLGLAAASASVAAWRLGRGELRSLLSSTRGE